MGFLRKYAILIILLIGVLACGLITTPATPTAAVESSPTMVPTDTPASTATVAASDTPAPTQATSPSDTPEAASGSLPVPFSNLMDVSQYFNPVGQPVHDWNGVPIMPQATAGQEFKPGAVYSFKATATIEQAASFYQEKMPALGYASFMAGPATGSSGTGSNAMHNSFLYFTKDSQILLIYIASYDIDSGHVSVVISTE